jgi:hypothetical protein
MRVRQITASATARTQSRAFTSRNPSQALTVGPSRRTAAAGHRRARPARHRSSGHPALPGRWRSTRPQRVAASASIRSESCLVSSAKPLREASRPSSAGTSTGSDSDEIRLLTGRSQPPVPGMVFYDAWEVAGDGGPGFTWSNKNPLAAVSLLPDRRFDYVLSAWPRRGGAGHPVRCELLGVRSSQETQLSDHYGAAADLRY